MAKDFIRLPAKPGDKEISRSQGVLPFKVEKQSEIEGIGMGVLSDGTPFLNQRGLARLAGIENAHIGTISSQWDEPEQKPRITTVKELLRSRGIEVQSPHMILADGGRTMFAYPDYVALAILEYYAFEAGPNVKSEAVKNFRILAGNGLREFIYTQVGYSSHNNIPIAWQQFHDRVTAAYGGVPKGYFSVFKEAADLIVTLIRNGADVGHSSSNGFAAAEIHDRDQLGAYVLIRFPDPKAPKTSREEDREAVMVAAKEYLEAVIAALA